MKKQRIRTLSAIALAATAVLGAQTSAQAATANSADIPVNLTVNAPLCTIANGNASISLPAVSNQTTTINQWYSANSITTTGQRGTPFVTSAALNQTATISCSLANTIVTSFVVQPGTSAILYNGTTGEQLLGDATTPTPVKAAGGNLMMSFEQVSVNGAAAPYSYDNASNGAIQPYTTAFTTGALSGSTSTATVVWRPQFYTVAGTTAIGSPQGGSFVGHAQIVANY